MKRVTPGMKRVLVGLMLVLQGCGQGAQSSPEPPDDKYDPGLPKPGGYGSGSGQGSTGGTTGGGGDQPDMAGPAQCAEADRRCAHEFVFAGRGDETTVTVIGSFDGWGAGAAMTLSGGSWRASVKLPWNTKVSYKLHVTYQTAAEAWIPDPAVTAQEDDGFGGKNSILDAMICTDWTCVASTPGPAGAYDWRDAVLYFVFVDRFLDGDKSNDDPLSDPTLKTAADYFGGDFAGIEQKIDDGYFASLGVNTLWLTVPMDNSESIGIGDDGENYSAYHGYWPRTLDAVESRFGTMDQLKALVAKAHANDIRVILDYAMNHVHVDAPIYQAHLSDGWFNPLMVNGQECVCGSSVCQWESDKKEECWFRNYLPDFNFNNADARKYSVDNALFWVQTTGVDGLRLDAIKHIELKWLTDLRTRLNTDVEPITKQHVYLVGETFTGDRPLIKSFIDTGKMLDGQFDFPLRANVNDTLLTRKQAMKDLISFMDDNSSFYGNAVMSTFIGNHDVPRSIHFAQDSPMWSDVWANGRDRSWQNMPSLVPGTSAYERMSVAMALLMTNQGVPLIYYGDEIGLPGAGDPDNRRPMEWDATKYSDGQKLLLARMQKLGAVRAAHSALRRGTRATLSQGTDTWVYSMTAGTDIVYVALNRGDAAQTVSGLPSQMLTDQMTGDLLSGGSISVPARSVRVLVP
jgi:glycosidase